ncbi:unnamed protein product [Rotaria sordida]|uniref:Nuclear receptor domain-containing protein n=1 Tax=Rotaria sordida TaxID=392033 RepID=A0A814NYY1_9BILA|nr:unnamed protein product [Rotaria sordida]CAF3747683.1 unnamed protein product [Rotaria sordida]
MYSNNNDAKVVSMEVTSVSDLSSISHKKIKTGRGSCAVCGAKPTGINFDVLTCSSCKAFFRRNGIKPLDQFICRLSGECKIDERSRRQCTACRLRKCFAMGMVKERIRTEEQNQRHRALVQENRRQKFKKYQQRQEETRLKIPEKHHHHHQLVCSTSYLFSNSHLHYIDLIFDLFIESTQQMIPEDFNFNYDYDLTNVLNLYCAPISCLIMVFKQLSQFQHLPVDDRLILLKNNIKILLPILTHLLNTTLDIQILVNHPGPHHINNKIAYASSLFEYIAPDDNKLLILLIVVFLFCPCLFTNESLYDAGYINNHSRKLIQYAYDEYIQLLWYYILEKSLDHENQAVLTYMKIVTTFLHLQNVTSEIYGIVECSVQADQLHMIMQSILHLT